MHAIFRPLLLAAVASGILLVLLMFTYSARAQSEESGEHPTNLRVQSTDDGVLLTWDAPAEDAESVTGYRIMRRNPDKYNFLGVRESNTGSTDTAYTDTSVTHNTRYVYRVRALRGGEQSEMSNFAQLRYRRPLLPQRHSPLPLHQPPHIRPRPHPRRAPRHEISGSAILISECY